MITKRSFIIDWLVMVAIALLAYPLLSIVVKHEVSKRFAIERLEFQRFANVVSESSPDEIEKIVEVIETASDDESERKDKASRVDKE